MSRLFLFFRQFRRHAWTELVMLGGAALCCLSMWVGLRLFSLSTLGRWTGRLSRRSTTLNQRKIDHVVWAARTASHALFPERPCLPQALAVRFLLARFGVPTDLQIGVQKEEGTLQAHAWLERKGDVLIGGHEAPSKYHILENGSVPSSRA